MALAVLRSCSFGRVRCFQGLVLVFDTWWAKSQLNYLTWREETWLLLLNLRIVYYVYPKTEIRVPDDRGHEEDICLRKLQLNWLILSNLIYPVHVFFPFTQGHNPEIDNSLFLNDRLVFCFLFKGEILSLSPVYNMPCSKLGWDQPGQGTFHFLLCFAIVDC